MVTAVWRLHISHPPPITYAIPMHLNHTEIDEIEMLRRTTTIVMPTIVMPMTIAIVLSQMSTTMTIVIPMMALNAS